MQQIALAAIFGALFIWAVYRYVKFRHSRKIFKSVSELEKIVTTGKPFIVPTLPAVPNRKQRRRMNKLTKNKSNVKN